MLIKLWDEGYVEFHYSAGMYQTYVVSSFLHGEPS